MYSVLHNYMFILLTNNFGNNCKWDPTELTFLYYMDQHFKFVCKYWPDDGLLRLKIVANNRITIK